MITGSKLKISSVIRDLLIQDGKLNTLVSGKVFPLYAPDNTDGDFILYKRDKYTIERSKMGVYTQKCELFINVVSTDYDRGQDIAEMVFDILEGNYSDGMAIRLIDSAEDTVDKKYIQVLLFSIE